MPVNDRSEGFHAMQFSENSASSSPCPLAMDPKIFHPQLLLEMISSSGNCGSQAAELDPLPLLLPCVMFVEMLLALCAEDGELLA